MIVHALFRHAVTHIVQYSYPNRKCEPIREVLAYTVIELIPFVKQVVHSVRQEINEESLKRYGERLFQVRYTCTITLMLLMLLYNLMQVTEVKLFYTCWGKDVGSEMDEDTVKSCIEELAMRPKLSMHARKIGKFQEEDWRQTKVMM